MGLQVQRPELVHAEDHAGITEAGFGQAVGDRVEGQHPGGLGVVIGIGAGLVGLHRLKADVLVTKQGA
jgi:hypothetical protein